MDRHMLDILACPVDKSYPLQLYEVISNSSGVDIGVLACPSCSRFYPIIDGIPVMFPDNLRERQKDLEFLGKWKDKLPDKIIKQGNPWHL